MANPFIPQSDFTTGQFHLPDGDHINPGRLEYNGCLFSPIFATNMAGVAVKDNALRTVKYMEWTLTADGYVTMRGGATDTNSSMDDLRVLLSAQGGELIYLGRGMDIHVNIPGRGGLKDVVWGPVPEILDFQPLGCGRSAKIKWQVKVRIPEIRRRQIAPKGAPIFDAIALDPNNLNAMEVGGVARIPLLQLNYETTVRYGEDGYSSLSVKGTMEIPMTRVPTQETRTVEQTVDDVRNILNARIFGNIDLARFRITQREFNVSRDKRTMEWSVTAEEKPYMDLPPDITVARGTFNVRPAKVGMGLATWLCTLRATYTVRGDRPRRIAWMAFLSLLRIRMLEAERANIPGARGGGGPAPQNQQAPEPNVFQRMQIGLEFLIGRVVGNNNSPLEDWQRLNRGRINRIQQQQVQRGRAFLIDFSFDEGLYLDSKNVTFSATWRLITTFSHIMVASGLWKKVPENAGIQNRNASPNVWAASMKDIMGTRSWLPNKLDPNVDIIVDFGSD